MKKTATISSYIAKEPPAVRAALKKMHSILKKAAPKAGEKLAWGMPALTLEGNLVHFAAFKNHLSLFPGTEAIVHFAPKLKKYTTSKGTIQFPYGEKLPATLIATIMKYRVKQNLLKAKKKTKKAR